MMKSRLLITVAALLVPAAFSPAAFSSGPPSPALKERCAVCGMFVGGDPKWTAAVVLKDRTNLFFDGPKDLFRYAAEPGKYGKGKSPAGISAAYVTEYYSARLVRAEGLLYVVGSDVYGPMGAELVPVEGKEKAETFRLDHKGRKVLRYGEVTAEELAKLR